MAAPAATVTWDQVGSIVQGLPDALDEFTKAAEDPEQTLTASQQAAGIIGDLARVQAALAAWIADPGPLTGPCG